jgi:(p)ppGpp synthase/HD superfamily hydrolase
MVSVSDEGADAAFLHDTIEDTETTLSELDEQFGQTVRKVVQEITDDKDLDKTDRKRRQIEHAPHLSSRRNDQARRQDRERAGCDRLSSA